MSPELDRLLTASAVLLAYALFCGWTVRATFRRRPPTTPFPNMQGAPPVLVAYASQTGFAEELAGRTAALLQAGAVPVRVSGVDGLDADALASTHRALFLVSTTGEGDAPDSAAHFVSRVMGNPARLKGLDYGLLALGDSSYARYCDFGRRLDAWLQAHGATPLFDRIELDRDTPHALSRWQAQIEELAGTASGRGDLAIEPDFAAWRLMERRLLNPDGLGGPVFCVALEPLSGQPAWQAGDIAVVAPGNSPQAVEALLATCGFRGEAPHAGGPLSMALTTRQLPHDVSALVGLSGAALLERLKPLPRREYSIASVPQDGRLELLVRQVRGADGSLGVGSGWLTAHVPIGGEVALRLRPNHAFRAPAQDMPMIFIGNGTGIAGLRAHLHARLRAGRQENWLLFGERSHERDFLCGEEIERWLAAGDLARLDLAFSRTAPRRYVQDALRDQATALRRWVDAGAAILVCGSQQGMAPGVHAVLQEVLGEGVVSELTAQGRYRRDVY